MSVLEKLIRYHKFLLDEKRRVLQDVQTEEDRIETSIDDLANEVLAEQHVAKTSPDYGPAYGRYAQRALDQRAALHEELAEANVKVEAARSQLADAFEELKKFEITKDNHDRAELEEFNRREQIELDEIAVVGHIRRKGERG